MQFVVNVEQKINYKIMLSLSSVLLSFLLVFFAEIGDKSQLVILSLTTKFKVAKQSSNINNNKDYKNKNDGLIKIAWKTILGATFAFGLLNLLAVIFGSTVIKFISLDLMYLIAGIIFIVFAVLNIVNFFSSQKETQIDTENEVATEISESENKLKKFKLLNNPFLLTFVMIFFAEFGDKTQLLTANLATIHSSFSVWFGATLALFTTSLIATFCGVFLLNKIPKSKRYLILFSGLLFLYLGVVYLLK